VDLVGVEVRCQEDRCRPEGGGEADAEEKREAPEKGDAELVRALESAVCGANEDFVAPVGFGFAGAVDCFEFGVEECAQAVELDSILLVW
jgi:hypothetical protein